VLRLIKKSRETTVKGPNVLRIVATLAAALAAMPANAQIYPDHPVKIVLPFGVASPILARASLPISSASVSASAS
jgi:hypothetical protein